MTDANANTRSAPTRPNFYILLDLKLNEPWDEAKFKDILRTKRIEWSRLQSNIGQKALIAQRNLRLIPEIETVMCDEQARKKELEEALVQDAVKNQKKREDFEKQIEYINNKDAIDKTELDKFILDFQDIYTKDEILKRVKVAIASPAEKGQEQPLLEATLIKSINDLLLLVHKASLYDFLELSSATGTAELGRAAAALYQREVQRTPKNDDVIARTALAGHAKLLFSAEETRRQYDESLRQGSINRLLDELEVIMNRVDSKELQAGQVRLFLENAQQAGWSRDDAFAHLRKRAKDRKWYLAPTEVENQIPCPNCRTLNNSVKNFCRNCGEKLHIACPNCGEPVVSGDRICDHCRFEVGNRFRVKDLLKQLNQFVAAEKLGEARETLRLLDDLWQPQKPDELRNSINERKAYIEQYQQKKLAEQKTVEVEFISLVKDKKLYEASSFLQKHRNQMASIPGIASQRTQLQQDLTRAESLRRSLERDQHSLKPDNQIERYREIADICRDLPGLDNLRVAPNPPGDLRAKVQGTIVSLSWQPSTTEKVEYTIVRKELARPNSAQDGQEVGSNLAGCSYDDDAAALVGTPLYYAVYSGYSGVLSDTAAVLMQPVLLTQSVRSLQAKAGDQQIELSWEPPANVYSVAVVRNEQTAPASISDGVRVGEYRPSQKRLSDQHIQNGQTYYYAFYCQFRDQNGNMILSLAEHISATPDVPPRPLQRLDIKSKRVDKEYEVTITWDRPARGQVEIRKTPQPFSLPFGTVKPERELFGNGERLGQHQNQTVEHWPQAGVAYYTPLLMYQGMAYVGTCQRFACVEALTELEILNLGDRLQFSWRWPDDCQEVQIAYSKLDWPGPGVADTVRKNVSRAQYENLGGHWYLAGATDQEYYVSVAAVMTIGKDRIVAEGLRRQVRQREPLEIDYEIKRGGFLHSKPALSLTVSRLDDLPAMVLVALRDRLPLNKHDGDSTRIPAQRARKYTFPVDFSLGNVQPGMFAKLFLEDDAANDWIRINTPGKEKLRLS